MHHALRIDLLDLPKVGGIVWAEVIRPYNASDLPTVALCRRVGRMAVSWKYSPKGWAIIQNAGEFKFPHRFGEYLPRMNRNPKPSRLEFHSCARNWIATRAMLALGWISGRLRKCIGVMLVRSDKHR